MFARFFAPHKESHGNWTATRLPYLWDLDDTTVRNNNNSLFASFEVGGPDGLTADFETMTLLRNALADILNDLDGSWTFYVHRMMRKVDVSCTAHASDGFAADVDQRWRDSANLMGQHEYVVVLSLLCRSDVSTGTPVFKKTATTLLKTDTSQNHAELNRICKLVSETLPLNLKRMKFSDGMLGGFLQAITTGEFVPEYRSKNRLLSDDVSNSDLTFGLNGRIELGSDKVAAVLWVKKYPLDSEPGFLDGLDARPGINICHSYSPRDREAISRQAQLRVSQMMSQKDAAETLMADLQATANDIESRGLGFGSHQLTITVFADSEDELEERVSEITSAARKAKVILIREKWALEPTFFAQHIGNEHLHCRNTIISTVEFANFAALHSSDAGTAAEYLPWKTPISIMNSAQGTVHRFSFHPQGDPKKEPTNGHTLILGPSNAGKTTTALFLAAQSLRAGGRLIAFDKDHAMRMAVTALGGQYASVQAGKNTGLNPLLTERDRRGQKWLEGWLSKLLEQTGERLKPRQTEALINALRQNAEAPDAGRNFSNFQTLIGDAEDGRDLAMRIAEWGPDGRYGWAFGRADKPVVDLKGNPVTAIDLTEIMTAGIERTAILGYLFRAIEVLTEDRVPTVLMIDEAWQALDDEYFAGMLKNWLVTARRKNVVVVMLTQFPSQIRESKAGQTILEGLPNKLLFPNHAASEEDYEGYALTNQELDFLIGSGLKTRTALWKTTFNSTLLDVDLSCLGSLLTVLGGGESGIKKFGLDYETKPTFWRA